MLTKNEIKYYSSLLRKKERYEEKKFLAEGRKIVEEGLNSIFECEIVTASQSFIETHPEFISIIRKYNPKFEVVNNKDFLKLSDTENPQGIAAVFKMPQKNYSLEEAGFITALENVTDPGNAGTIIRTCDWFKVDGILLSENSVDPFNPKVVRSTMGSLFHLPVLTSDNFISDIKSLKTKKYRILCADMNGSSIYGYKSSGKTVVIFANEANGLSLEVKQFCDDILSVPGSGRAESLNVAAAAAVIISELTRTR